MPKTVTGDEAAKMLGVSKAYLYKLMEQGKLHRVQSKRSIIKSRQPLVFNREEVESLLEQETDKDESDNPSSRVRVA